MLSCAAVAYCVFSSVVAYSVKLCCCGILCSVLWWLKVLSCAAVAYCVFSSAVA